MLPALRCLDLLEPVVVRYLKQLAQLGFSGEIATDYASRLTLSTDNSIYQLIPQAILFVRSTQDVSLALKLANTPEFSTLKFYPRGGGTGTNGQALGQGIVLDLSRHMNHILNINTPEKEATVQAGVIKDALNAALKNAGLFFSPDLSTSNRATIGGMINTDAAGQGSLVYGKTSDHVKRLTVVLATGEIVHLGQGQSNPPEIEAACQDALATAAPLLDKHWPKLQRFATGYDLVHGFDAATQTVNLVRLFCGSEGTLGIVTEAVLDLDDIPSIRVLVNVCYQTFEYALRHAPFILNSGALSIESQDEQVLALAQQDIIWPTVAPLLGIKPEDTLLGLNCVEFAGTDLDKVQQDVKKFCQMLHQNGKTHGVSHFHVCDHLEDIQHVYTLRKKSVGLLGNLSGAAKPQAFVEDTGVPPEHLADYILEFRALLDGYGLKYGMFGHVDAGVLHVRPALDLHDANHQNMLQEISDAVFVLTKKYGGVLWGEHGRGQRSAYGPEFFGPLWPTLCAIKSAFDPTARLNPSKIAIPSGQLEPLAGVKAPLRADFDQQIPVRIRDNFEKAFACNGNGLCFNFEPTHVMCPSMRVTQDRRHSPKGRTQLMREWLRLLRRKHVDLESKPPIWQRLKHIFTKRTGDFSHEVFEAMSGCLGCKACVSQCPVHVDVPELKSQFLEIYHHTYPRSMRDALMGRIERLLPVLWYFRFLWNGLQEYLPQASRALGLVDLPKFSAITPAQWAKKSGIASACLEDVQNMSETERARCVIIVQDAFTHFFDAKAVCAWITCIGNLGYTPYILDYQPMGKAASVKGLRNQFKQEAYLLAQKLHAFATLNITLVGFDPAMVLPLRDEYLAILPEHMRRYQVLLPQEWLSQVLEHKQTLPVQSTTPYYLFSHCSEKSKNPQSALVWQRIFKHLGLTLIPVSTGCCGMAGTFGHEQEHVSESQALFQLIWADSLESIEFQQALATGYSCRSQVNRLISRQIQHPIQVLGQVIENNFDKKYCV